MSRSEKGNKLGCGCAPAIASEGCGGCGCLLTLGAVLTIFGAAVGGTISARIPWTESNVTLAGAVGNKELTRQVPPSYLDGKISNREDFINSTLNSVIGPIEGYNLFIVGIQPGAPVLDLNLKLTRDPQKEVIK